MASQTILDFRFTLAVALATVRSVFEIYFADNGQGMNLKTL
ncbi:hypothetical protein [Nostoc sp. JL31]|nr:hypothetical protein [Nostoc sp. JL31]